MVGPLKLIRFQLLSTNRSNAVLGDCLPRGIARNVFAVGRLVSSVHRRRRVFFLVLLPPVSSPACLWMIVVAVSNLGYSNGHAVTSQTNILDVFHTSSGKIVRQRKFHWRGF